MPSRFSLQAPFEPAGDQPQAIEKLIAGIRSGQKEQTLMGVTGSGKTNVMGWVLQELNRPVLVMRSGEMMSYTE